MYTCANCTVVACAAETKENLPKNCPMRNEENMREIYAEYEKEENHRFYTVCSSIEAQGYCQWPRLKETIEFCRNMNYRKIGIAFCKGLHKEALVVAGLFRKQGFEVAPPRRPQAFRKNARFIPDSSKPCATPSARPRF